MDNSKKILDTETIKKFIPHRYPFLLIDKILEMHEGESILALKNVTINENFFNGHFPEKPVMPGVLIIEAMAQASSVLVASSANTPIKGKVIYFMSIEKAHFRKPVVPGDTIHIHVKQIQSRHNVWKMQGEAKVDDIKVADAIFSAMLADKNKSM